MPGLDGWDPLNIVGVIDGLLGTILVEVFYSEGNLKVVFSKVYDVCFNPSVIGSVLRNGRS